MATLSKPLPPLTAQDIARFWSKVDQSPGQGPQGNCWGWMAGVNNKKRAVFAVNNRMRLATRIAYFLQYGEDPHPLMVCHTCDNPPCCRGEHLFKGTQANNLSDMTSKGRRSHGQSAGWLTSEQVYQIRVLWATGQYRQWQLAELFGSSQSHISQITTGQQRILD